MMTDSRSLFDFLTRDSYTTEKQRMIDLQTVESAYHTFEVNHVAFI